MSNASNKNSSSGGLSAIGRLLDVFFAKPVVGKLADANFFLLVGMLIFFATATSLPNYTHFQFGGGKLGEAAISWKFKNPFSPIPVKEIAAIAHDENSSEIMTHLEKRSYRLLVPLIAYTFGFGLKGALVCQQILACLLLLLTLATLRKVFQDNLAALFGSLALAVSFPGQWGFCDFFYFDGYAYFLIALAVWTSSTWGLALAVFAGCLSDERVAMVTPLLWVWINIRNSSQYARYDLKSLLRLNRYHLAIIIGLALFILFRLYIAVKWGAFYDDGQMWQWQTIMKCIHFLPSAILTGLKGAFIVPIAAGMLLVSCRQLTLLSVVALAALPSICTSLLVIDLSRSLYYAFPLMFISTAVLAQQSSVSDCRKIMFCAFVGSVIFPTCVVGPFNIHLLNY